jgi:uncharacterized protein (DUF1501 family)
MTQNQQCCDDFRRAGDVSRRRFLGGMAAAGVAATTTSLFGQAVRQASFGAAPGGNVMVVLSFRGGIDGLGMVVPYGDTAYYDPKVRKTIAVPADQLIATDGFFGLHPKLAPLKWLWDENSFAAVQAVGMELPNRSHFAAMELVEDADPGSSLRQGWVNRMVGIGSGGSAVDAVHMGDSNPPTMIEGPAPTVATNGLDGIALSGSDNGWNARRRGHLKTMWDSSDGPLSAAASSALSTVKTLGAVGKQGYKPAVSYPRVWPGTDLSDALKDSAQLIKADIGTEVISIDFGSWDMHADYGNLGGGEMQSMTSAFAQCLDAFMRDLGPLAERVTVVTISEFGRRIVENGNRGLDHGWGNMMLVLGGGVNGGRYHGTWPGLAHNNQVDGDLKVTTDYRQVLGEIVHKRFPGKDVTQVFPGLSYNPIGVLR